MMMTDEDERAWLELRAHVRRTAWPSSLDLVCCLFDESGVISAHLVTTDCLKNHPYISVEASDHGPDLVRSIKVELTAIGQSVHCIILGILVGTDANLADLAKTGEVVMNLNGVLLTNFPIKFSTKNHGQVLGSFLRHKPNPVVQLMPFHKRSVNPAVLSEWMFSFSSAVPDSHDAEDLLRPIGAELEVQMELKRHQAFNGYLSLSTMYTRALGDSQPEKEGNLILDDDTPVVMVKDQVYHLPFDRISRELIRLDRRCSVTDANVKDLFHLVQANGAQLDQLNAYGESVERLAKSVSRIEAWVCDMYCDVALKTKRMNEFLDLQEPPTN